MNIEHRKNGEYNVYFIAHDDLEKEFGYEDLAHAYTEKTSHPPRYLVNVYGRTEKYVYFCNFLTREKLRNKGYGRKLIQEVKEYYKGCVVYLAVGAYGGGTKMTNKQLIDFYLSEGFNVIEHSDYPYKNHTVMAIKL